MKFYLKPILSVIALAIMLGYSGCKGKDPDPTPVDEQQLALLSATWKVGTAGNVTLDNVSKKADYAAFQLVLTGTPGATTFGYTTTGRPPLSAWPSSGDWKFDTAVETSIIRDPGNATKELNVSYTVTETQLELTFTYNGAGEARTSDVTGVWVFTLTK
jgi:hypothetical protein